MTAVVTRVESSLAAKSTSEARANFIEPTVRANIGTQEKGNRVGGDKLARLSLAEMDAECSECAISKRSQRTKKRS